MNFSLYSLLDIDLAYQPRLLSLFGHKFTFHRSLLKYRLFHGLYGDRFKDLLRERSNSEKVKFIYWIPVQVHCHIKRCSINCEYLENRKKVCVCVCFYWGGGVISDLKMLSPSSGDPQKKKNSFDHGLQCRA